MSYNIVHFPDYEGSTLLNKAESYLTDKVDKSILNDIIFDIKYHREKNLFNDDIYFDVIKVLADNKKLEKSTKDNADRVYEMIEKDNNDYSFFLKILPYVCEKDTYYMFWNLYNMFENKYYFIPLFKKIEEIKKYQRQNLNSDLPIFDAYDYFLKVVVKGYRTYYIDDKTYLSAIMEVLNQYLKDNTYSGEYDHTLDYMNGRKMREIIEYDNLDLQETENNMNLVSNKIDDTKEVINNTTNAINNNINKLDSEIDNFNNRLIEIIKNHVDKVDYQSIIKASSFNKEIDEQRKIISDLTITKLEKQKNEKVKEIFNKIKEYITTNNLCEENKEIEKVILNELNSMDYSELKEQRTIDYCILTYFANANDNLEYVPFYTVHENFNTWLKALDKKVSSKFAKGIYRELLYNDFYIVKEYIENDMIDILANLCNCDKVFVGEMFKYHCISIPAMKKLIKLFDINRVKLLNEIQIDTISRLSEDQFDYYKSILDINRYSEISGRELLYPNQIFDEIKTASLSYTESSRLAGSLRLASKSISDFENMPSVNIDKTKLRSAYKGEDYKNVIYIDELDSIYKSYLNYLTYNTGLSYSCIPPFEFIFMYANSFGDDLSKFKEFIHEYKEHNIYNDSEYNEIKQKFLDKYNLHQMITIEKNTDWYKFMRKSEEEQYNLLCKYQKNELIKNKIILRRR